MAKRNDDPWGIVPADDTYGMINQPQRLPVGKENRYIDDGLQEHTTNELAKGIEATFAGEIHTRMAERIFDQTERGLRGLNEIVSRPGNEQQMDDMGAIGPAMKKEFARRQQAIFHAGSNNIIGEVQKPYEKPREPEKRGFWGKLIDG